MLHMYSFTFFVGGEFLGDLSLTSGGGGGGSGCGAGGVVTYVFF